MKPCIAVLFGGCSDEYEVSLHSAQAVLEDGADAVADYDRARFSGFSSEERRLYAVLSARIQKNMEQSLQ